MVEVGVRDAARYLGAASSNPCNVATLLTQAKNVATTGEIENAFDLNQCVARGGDLKDSVVTKSDSKETTQGPLEAILPQPCVAKAYVVVPTAKPTPTPPVEEAPVPMTPIDKSKPANTVSIAAERQAGK